MADLRRLMKERAASKRIEHPYARYNNSGSLSCSLCSLAIKSEVLWPSHLTSKVHRSNVKKEKDAQEVQATQSLSNGKRAASANEDEEMDQDGQQDRQKRVRIDESATSNEATPSTSSLPPGFFDNPADAPNDQDMPAQENEEEDPEWAAFEATLAEEQPQASTSAIPSGANASTYASATISAGEVLYTNGDDGEEGNEEQNDAEEEEEENDEPKETEEERRDREEREELMERIETEEREQQEADERVDSLKKRLSAMRASKKAGSSSSSRNGGVQVNGVAEHKEPVPEARQRRNRRLRGNA